MTNWYEVELSEDERIRNGVHVEQLKIPVYREESPYNVSIGIPVYLSSMYVTLFDGLIRNIGKNYLKGGPMTFREFQFSSDRIQFETDPGCNRSVRPDEKKPNFLKKADLPLLADLHAFRPDLESQINQLITLFGIND